MAHTTEDYTETVFEAQHPSLRSTITIPKGTRVEIVDQPMGIAWAVADVPLLIALTGNTHDPKYRYVFVPNSIVAA